MAAVKDETYEWIDAVWSGFFGLIYRKFFWDFVNGILRNPGGVQYVLFCLLINRSNGDADPPSKTKYLSRSLSRHPSSRFLLWSLDSLSSPSNYRHRLLGTPVFIEALSSRLFYLQCRLSCVYSTTRYVKSIAARLVGLDTSLRIGNKCRLVFLYSNDRLHGGTGERWNCDFRQG